MNQKMHSTGSTSAREPLIEWIEQGALAKENIPAAIALTRLYPGSNHWRAFISSMLLWLGGLALAFALMFFIAYNWDALGRFAKFALVEIFIVIAIAAYCKWHQSVIGQLTLLIASIGLGVLLAFYGQTYQTGADPWQLFFNWALLMLPWVLVARFAALWILWLALINLSCVLYLQTNSWGWRLFPADNALWPLFFINTFALILWETASRKFVWLDRQWAKRIIAVGSGSAATLLVLESILGQYTSIWPVISWLIAGSMLFFYYRKIRPDLFMLAGGCLSGVMVFVSLTADNLLNDLDSAGSFLLLGLLIIGLSGAAAAWLRKVHKELEA